MENIGFITEIKNDRAKIKVKRDSACGSNCQSCGGCELKEHFIEADIKTDFLYSPSPGDEVKIKLDNKTFYLYSATGYAIFVALLIIGGFLGYNFYKTETASFLGALCGLLIGFIIVKFIFRNKKTCLKIEKGGN